MFSQCPLGTQGSGVKLLRTTYINTIRYTRGLKTKITVYEIILKNMDPKGGESITKVHYPIVFILMILLNSFTL